MKQPFRANRFFRSVCGACLAVGIVFAVDLSCITEQQEPTGPVLSEELKQAGGSPMGPVTTEEVEEAQAVIDETLRDCPDEAAQVSQLMELLLSEERTVPRLAADELKGRELDEGAINRLETIVRFVPFSRSRGDVRMFSHAGAKVTSEFAWEVLAEVSLRDRSEEEQLEWLIKELRYCRPFGDSRSNRAAKLLAKMGETAVPRLIRVLQRDSSNAQLWAGRTLM